MTSLPHPTSTPSVSVSSVDDANSRCSSPRSPPTATCCSRAARHRQVDDPARGRRSGRHRIRVRRRQRRTHPGALAGQFDPSRVLEDGYTPDVFVDGPLVEALRHGSLLYVEELNRVPEETVNLLITVMSEGELTLPRLGTIPAADGFRLVAAMNPFDNIGTARSPVRSTTACVACDGIPIPRRRVRHRRAQHFRRRSSPAAPGRRRHTRYSQPPRCACRFIRARGDRSGRGGPRTASMRSAQVTDPSVGLDAALTALSGASACTRAGVPRPSRSSPTCGTRCCAGTSP